MIHLKLLRICNYLYNTVLIIYENYMKIILKLYEIIWKLYEIILKNLKVDVICLN